MLRGIWAKFDRDWGWNLGRLLAYAAIEMLFAVAGLELIVLSLALRLMDPQYEQRFVAQVLRLLPDRVSVSAVAAFERSVEFAPVWLLIVGLPITLWYGTRFFVVLESALCVIFRRRQRTFLGQNRVALLMLLLFAALLPIIVLSIASTPHFTSTTAHAASVLSTPWPIGGATLPMVAAFLASLAANFMLFAVAYARVTPGGVSLRSVWPGALLGAGTAQLYLLFFPFYVHYVLHPDHFGTVAGFVLVIAVFFFAYAICIVVGAELAAWREGLRAAPRDIPTTLAAGATEIQPAPAPIRDSLFPTSGPLARLDASPVWQESGRASRAS
jgi:uncharacterized BrkB/YihY/UPF0761 family membrane protein